MSAELFRTGENAPARTISLEDAARAVNEFEARLHPTVADTKNRAEVLTHKTYPHGLDF